MIKINLMTDEESGGANATLFISGYLASLVLMIGFCFYLSNQIGGKIDRAENESSALTSELASLKETTREVRDLEKKREELENITAAIVKLRANQFGPVRIIDDLNMAIPEKAWITNIQETRENMIISGVAVTNFEIVTLMENLEKSDYFTRVDLVESLATGLVQITGYNHFTNNYFRHVVPVSEVNRTMNQIGAEARQFGLEFSTTDGPPVQSRAGDGVRLAGDGVLTRRASQKEEKVSAWPSLEQVQGISFSVKAAVSHAGPLSKAMEDQDE